MEKIASLLWTSGLLVCLLVTGEKYTIITKNIN